MEKVRHTRRSTFYRFLAIHVVCRGPVKNLQRRRSDFLRRHQWCEEAESAFTLVEMLIVCTLISIVLAIGVPTLRNTLFTDDLSASSRKIIGMVKGMREKSIRYQQGLVLRIDMEQGTLWHEEENLEGVEVQESDKITLPDNVKITDVWTRTDGKTDFGSLSLWITKRGYMDNTVIHLNDDDDSIRSIVFSPFLGSIKVFDEYVNLE